MKVLLFFCSIFFALLNVSAYEYEVSACCIFQDEDRFLKEWIDYHRLIGVEHFYMYDNKSSDECKAVLEPYIKKGIVEYIYWDKDYDTAGQWWAVQRNAYLDALERTMGKSKWLCIIDTDEFIVPIKDKNLPSFLKDYEEFGGVFINWVFYGASGVQRIPEKTWMITCLLHRAKLGHSGHRLVKSIVRPERVDLQKSSFPHTCAYIAPYYHVNPDKKQPIKGKPKDICIDRIRINHYWSRDLDYLMEYKYTRNKRWYGEKRAQDKVNSEKEMNDFYDPLMLDILKKVKKQK